MYSRAVPTCPLFLYCCSSKTNHCKYKKFSPNVYVSVIYIHLNFQNFLTLLSHKLSKNIFKINATSFDHPAIWIGKSNEIPQGNDSLSIHYNVYTFDLPGTSHTSSAIYIDDTVFKVSNKDPNIDAYNILYHKSDLKLFNLFFQTNGKLI
ncbi:putative RNA-directed DNA polymerase from transposon X-element [Aphis craccivora]|uniref:Putative RNA-directed DNA polymerase from transposon X-element n=1 Tax=Aphis craccivora TaxID=307492 RepID=A0A6G0Y5F8_APHCR|nr:putative RNA-directed DNA polymerase from transposon X-element [Aphis craccivora]